MPFPFLRLANAGLLLAAVLAAAPVPAQHKPSLSSEIGTVMETDGVDAARQRFAEIYPGRKDEYEVDIQGLMTVAQGYMQAGDMERGMAVMEMLGLISQDMASAAISSYNPQMAQMQQQAIEADRAADMQAAREREQSLDVQGRAEAETRGQARNDLDRFKGIYGDPADRDRLRTLFVTVSCDGYLVTGPMWADVGPWWMKSAADSVFTYADNWTRLRMEFTGSGEAARVTHDVEGLQSPAQRLGALPGDWPECQERPLR